MIVRLYYFVKGFINNVFYFYERKGNKARFHEMTSIESTTKESAIIKSTIIKTISSDGFVMLKIYLAGASY